MSNDPLANGLTIIEYQIKNHRKAGFDLIAN